jgi:hypothetical protein
MAKTTLPRSIVSLTPAEQLELERKASVGKVLDASLQDLVDAPFGAEAIGFRNTLMGSLAWSAGTGLGNLMGDAPKSIPLNLTKRKTEFDPMKDDISFSLSNNPETIATQLRDVPYEEWPYLLTSPDFGTFEDRYRFIMAAQPQMQEQYGSATGKALGLAADISAQMAVGLLAEPLVLSGLPMGQMAGRVGSAVLGNDRVMNASISAAEAVSAVSRTNLALRYGALGIAEEVTYQAARNTFDPAYDPSAADVIYGMTLAGTASSLVGGALFGRTFVRENVEQMVREFKATKATLLPGGYTVTYGRPFAFDSQAAADEMLFAPGTGTFLWEADRIARDLFDDWARTSTYGKPGFRMDPDLFIPGTRSMGLPVLDEAAMAAERAARRTPAKPKLGELMGMRSAIKAASFELSVAGAKMDSVLFSKVAQALVKTELTKVRMGAFNKAFWEEVSKDLPPEVVAKLRPAGERTFIAGIDRTLQDLTTRESMVDSVWEYFRFGRHKEFKEKEDASLIFQVLQEVRNRGGTVNRNTVADVVDELRVISQNPPKRMNKRGVLTLDLNARRAAVIEVINKRAKDGRKIHVNNELVKRLNPGKMALGKPAAGGVGGGGRVGDIGGGAAAGGEGRAGLADASDVVKALPWWHNLPGLGVIGNQSAYAHTSENGWARLIANLGFNARRDYGTAQQFTLMEKGLQAYYSLMGNYLRAYKTAYIRFAMGNGVDNIARDVDITDALVSTFKGKGMRLDFDRRVAAQLRTGAYDDSVEAVNEAAQEMRRILNKVHDIANASGLKGFQKTAVVNYFPRVWRWDRIRRLSTTEEGRKSLTALVKQSIDQNGRKVVMDGVETTFTEDIDDAATVFAERLMAIANKTENAPTVQQEQELFDAIVGLEGPLKDKVGSKTPFGRSRILLDETATISTSSDLLNKGEGLGLSIADLSNDDLPFVFRKYLTSVLGAVNEKELLNAFNSEMKARGVLGPKMTKRGKEVRGEVEVTGIDEMFAMARKLGGVIEPRHESALREVVSALRFEPIHHGRTAVGDKVLQIVLPLGYLSTGGQFGLAQIGEIARIVGTLGIRQVVEQMPILTEMLQNWKNLDKPTQNMASLMDSWFSPSTERLRRVISQGVGDLTPDPYSNVAARTLSSMANVMSDVSLLAPATSFTQQLTAATTMQHLWEVSKGLSRRLDDSTLRTLGVNTQQYQELVDYVGKNAQTRAGFLGDRIVGMDNIDGIQMDLLKSFVDRMVRTRVQDMPTRGDFHKSMFSFVGKLMTQFRSFNIKGVDNFLMQNVSRTRNGGGATVAQEIVATLMFAGTIQYLRNWADWKSYTAAGDRERADDTAKRMDFAGMVRGAFTGPSEFFVPGFVMDTIWTKAIDKDPILSPYRYSGLDLYGFPGWAIGERSGGIVRDVYGATVGRTMGLDLEREITKGTIHKARLLLPFQNLLFVKQYLNIAEQEIADYYNLSDIQPRRRPE